MLTTILQLLVILGLNAYLPWRLGNLFALNNKMWLYILFAVGLISGFAAMSLVTRFDNVLISIYYNLAWVWLGTVLYLTCFMIIFEIASLIHKLPAVKSGWTVIILALAVSAFSIINAVSFKAVNVTIPIKGLINEVKIVQISDVHLGVARGESYLAKIV